MWRALKLLDRFKCEYEMKTIKEQRVGTRFLARNILGVEGLLKLRDGTRKNDKHLITHMDLYEIKQQVSYCIVGALLVLG